MGRKDFGHKETKKPKKDAKKMLTTNIEPLPQVEVIKKGNISVNGSTAHRIIAQSTNPYSIYRVICSNFAAIYLNIIYF